MVGGDVGVGRREECAGRRGRARDQEVSLLRAALAERDMRLRDSKSELLGDAHVQASVPCLLHSTSPCMLGRAIEKCGGRNAAGNGTEAAVAAQARAWSCTQRRVSCAARMTAWRWGRASARTCAPRWWPARRSWRPRARSWRPGRRRAWRPAWPRRVAAMASQRCAAGLGEPYKTCFSSPNRSWQPWAQARLGAGHGPGPRRRLHGRGTRPRWEYL